jgi:hypothetical protein
MMHGINKKPIFPFGFQTIFSPNEPTSKPIIWFLRPITTLKIYGWINVESYRKGNGLMNRENRINNES